MPSGKNWLVFLYINLAFVILISSVYTLLYISNITNNWSQYRCDAILMPFAGLIMQSTLPPGTTQSQYTQQNFQYCTQNMMSNSMGDFLQPLEYNSQVAASNASNTSNSLNTARQNSINVRNSTNSIVQNLGNVFTNASANSKTISGYTSSGVGKSTSIAISGKNSISANIAAIKSQPKSF
jgi:hypothetical protein